MSTRSTLGRPAPRGLGRGDIRSGDLSNRRLQAAGGGPLNGSIDRFRRSPRQELRRHGGCDGERGRHGGGWPAPGQLQESRQDAGCGQRLDRFAERDRQLAIAQAIERVRQNRQQALIDDVGRCPLP